MMKRILLALLLALPLVGSADSRSGVMGTGATIAGKSTGGGGGAPEYEAVNVLLDGTSTYLTRGADLSGTSDSKKGMFSVWFRNDCPDNCGAVQYFLVGDAGGNSQVQIYINNPTDQLCMFLKQPTTAGVLGWCSSAGIGTRTSNWHHFAGSWDLATSTYQFYIDGTVDSSTANTGPVDNVIDYTLSNWSVGAQVDGTAKLYGELAEFYFTIGENLDLSTNLNKFYNAGKPVDLGTNCNAPTGNQPILCLRNALATWQNNVGSGGNFTENGTLLAGDAAGPSKTPLLIRQHDDVGGVTQANTTTSWTANLGPAYSNRRIIIAISMPNSYESCSGSGSGTINGVSATLIVYDGSGGSIGSFSGRVVFMYADVPSGAGGQTVSITNCTSTGNGSVNFVSYSVDKSLLSDGSPTSNSNNCTSATSCAVTLNTGSNGFYIGASALDCIFGGITNPVVNSSTQTLGVRDNYAASNCLRFDSTKYGSTSATPSTLTYGWTTSGQAVAATFHWK